MGKSDTLGARITRMAEQIRARERVRRPWPPTLVAPEADWTHAGLRCLLLPPAYCDNRGPWNGYVRIPPEHPLAASCYDDVPVEVWGGLTFGCLDTDGFTWFGWDDQHLDLCPRSAAAETEALADQLARLGDALS